MPFMGAIESPANPLIRQIARALDDRTHLLLEGEKSILDAVAAGTSLDHVLHDESVRPGRLAAPDRDASPPRIARRSREAGRRAHAPARDRRRERRDVPTAEILARPGPVVFVFGIQDPGNLGAIVRVAEAAGGAGVIGAPGTADFFHPRAVRGSAGSVLRIPVSGPRLVRAVRGLRPGGRAARSAAPSPKGARTRSSRRRRPERSVLVIGAEGTGLPAGAYRYLDRRLSIPMRPPVDSLNAAVASALLLYSPSLLPPVPSAARTDRTRRAARPDAAAGSSPSGASPLPSPPGPRRLSSDGSRSSVSSSGNAILLGEHLRLKGADPRVRVTPRVGRQSGLAGELAQEPFAVESPLGRDLRQKQSATAAELEDQAVAPDDDRPRRSSTSRGGGENRDLDVAPGKLVRSERAESADPRTRRAARTSGRSA